MQRLEPLPPDGTPPVVLGVPTAQEGEKCGLSGRWLVAGAAGGLARIVRDRV